MSSLRTRIFAGIGTTFHQNRTHNCGPTGPHRMPPIQPPQSSFLPRAHCAGPPRAHRSAVPSTYPVAIRNRPIQLSRSSILLLAQCGPTGRAACRILLFFCGPAAGPQVCAACSPSSLWVLLLFGGGEDPKCFLFGEQNDPNRLPLLQTWR